MPLSETVTKTALAVAEKASAELPRWMDFLMPKRARRKQVADRVLAKALETPEALDEHDVEYLTDLLRSKEAEWLKAEYVKHRAADFLPALAKSPAFQEFGDEESTADPSFEDNLFAALRSVSVHDRPLLELYAQIRAGEFARPGSFSKRTCNIVKDLTAEVIASLEAVAPLRMCRCLPLQISCLLHGSSSAQFPSVAKEHWSDLLVLEEYGLVSLTHTSWTSENKNVHISGAYFMSLEGDPECVEFNGFPFTTTGLELLQLHYCPPADELKEWLTRSVPDHFSAHIISPI